MGAGKQLNIDLTVNANTKQAEKNIQELSDSLKKLADIQPLEGMSLNKDMQSAVTSARELQRHLSGAMNSKTGNLDLSKLSKSLKSANTDIATLSSGLLRAGRDGEQAFMNVQRALSTASVQINKANGLLGEFWVTLKNTARWQISSTALHAFVGSLQTAYGYAKNLDESLNNIRIVTGHNIEYMDKFAEKANKAAKALSSTTLDYTNASLIYYQQGLSDEEVSKRTEVTLKMANAAGESAEKISDQLTSVWNNFAKGSDNLEHYADAMVRLGAVTASSTDEIVDGVQKFASVASTIGLSFDNAAAALATITATTRESADVVGTALKTLFARIQGLNLGETLDDGTTVNKYSEALLKVGVNIKDANGNLKDMDTLLDEIGNRWQTLERDEKTALAQTVAGVRQYTQFMNLMENFDFYQENVARANNADGSLQEQADIYAESWKAARDRMRAAMEGIYDELLPTQTIIKITDGVTDVISGIETLIKGLGGLKGILLIVSSIALKQLGPELGASLQNGINKVTDFGGRVKDVVITLKSTGSLKDSFSQYFLTAEQNARKVADQLDQINSSGMNNVASQSKFFTDNLAQGASQATKLTAELANASQSTTHLSEGFDIYLTNLAKANNIQGIIDANAKRLTAEQKEQLSNLQQQVLAASERQLQEKQTLESLEAQRDALSGSYDTFLFDSAGTSFDDETNEVMFDSNLRTSNKNYEQLEALKNSVLAAQQLNEEEQKRSTFLRSSNGQISLIAENEERIIQLNTGAIKGYGDIVRLNTRINNIIKNGNSSVEERKKAINRVIEEETKNNQVLATLTEGYEKAVENLDNPFATPGENLDSVMRSALHSAERFAITTGNTSDKMEIISKLATDEAMAFNRMDAASGQTKTALSAISDYLKSSLEAALNLGNRLVSIGQAAMSISMAVNGLVNVFETLNDESATFNQKLMSISSAVLYLGQGLANLKTIGAFDTILAGYNNITALTPLATEQFTVARQMGEGFFKALGKGGSALLDLINPLVGKMMFLAAIVAGVVIIVKSLYEWWNKDAIAAEKAAKSAELLKERYNETKQAYEDLISSMEEYQTARDGLDSLTEGTDEFKTALKKANDQALELIKSYGLIRGQDYEVNDGRIDIYDSALEKKKNEYQQNTNITQQASLNADIGAQKAQNKSNLTNLSRQLNINDTQLNNIIEASRINPDLFNSSEDIAKALGFQINNENKAIESIQGAEKSILELTSALDAANSLQETNNELTAHNALENNEIVQNSSNSSLLKAIGSGIYQKTINENAKQYEEGYDTTQMQKALEAQGYKIKEGSLNTQKNTFQYWDENEQKYVNGSTTKEAIATTLATMDAAEWLNEQIEQLDNTLSGVHSTRGREGLTNLANNYDSTTGQFNANQWASNLTSKELKQAMDGQITSLLGVAADDLENFAQIYGMTAEELAGQLSEAATKVKENNLNDTDNVRLGLIDSSNMTTAQEKAFSNAFGNAFKNENNQLSDVGQLQQAATQNKDKGEGLTKLFTLLSGDNLGTDETIQQLEDLIEEYDLQGPAIKNLVEQVKALPRTYDTSTDEILAAKNKLDKITSKLKEGDTITGENYQELVDAGVSNLDNYFTKMSDGTYKLIGDADELKAAVDQITISGLVDQVHDYQEAIAQAAQKRNTTISSMAGRSLDIKDTKARLEAIQSLPDFNGYTNEKAADLKNVNIDTYNFTKEDGEVIQQMYQELLQSSVDLQTQTMMMATSFTQLQDILGQIGGYSTEAYGQALINLANNYENCSEEIKKYQDALQSGNKESQDAALELLEAATMIGEAAEKYGINADAAEVQSKQLASAYKLEAKAAANLAIRNARMNKGVASLVSNWKDWKKTLTTGKKISLDYAKAVSEVTDTIQDLVGATTDLELPADFFDNVENLKLLDKAMAGDAKSIELLGTKTAEATVKALEFNDALSSFQLDDGQKITLTSDEFDSEKEKVLAGITELQTAIQNGTIKIGDSIDSMDSDWVESLNKMALVTNMSVDEMNSLLNQMGVQAKVDVKYVEQDTEVPTYTEVKEPVKDYIEEVDIGDGSGRTRPRSVGSAWRTYVVPGKPQKVKGYVPVAQISTEDNPKTPEINEGKLPTTYTGHGSVSPSSTKKSGSGSKNKPTKQTTKKSDVVDRYKEITDSLDNVKRAQDKVKNGLDQLYGKSRLDAMDEYQAELQKEIDLLDTKAKKAKEYADEDWKSLQKLIHSSDAKYKFNFVRNKDGNITNYTSEMEKAYNLLHTYEEKANKMTSKDAQDAYREKWVTPLSDYLKEVNDLIDQYDESVSTMKETLEEKLARIYEQYQNMFDKLSHKLEVKIAVDDNELNKLNYYFDKVSDNVFKASEAFGYLYSQMKPTSAQLENVGDFAQELNELFYSGKIGEEQYAEGLQQAYDDTLNYLQSLRDIDNQMVHYYEETLQKATEKLTTYTDQMEHLTSVMDHYRSILTLMGRDTDYDKVLEILEGTAQTRKNNFEASQSWYEQMKKAKEDAAAMLAEARTDAEKEMAQISYDAAVEQFNQAEETMLANAESYGEALKEILTTKMQQAADAMNKALTDGMGWDVLNDSMSRTSAYQDEYLTKTNQIYEMNKLLNQVNSAIDKTNNQGAKNRYAQFAKEIEQLKEKNQLSQLELDIAQAKYKVLEAQIALEEAQNAKSTVRLQRDSEGNFGYVYTADQDKVNDAEQALADAENDLYNIRLNATNKYGQQKLQYEQELAEKLAELDEKAAEDAIYREGNYQEDRKRLIEEYQKLIEASNDLYNIAQQEDARVVQDAWVNGYKAIIDKGNEWKTAVGDYTNTINDAIGEWENASSTLNTELKNTTRSVEEITTESDAMYNQLKNDLIPALGKQLNLVEQLTLAYQRQRDAQLLVIQTGEKQLEQLQRLIELQASYTNANNGDEYASGGDYSLMMGNVAYGSDEYWSYYTNRQGKLNKNPGSGAVSNEDVDRFYFLGYKLGQGMWSAYSKFQQIPADKWADIREEAKNAGWVKHFDTGGYTGKWGTEGRLAFLHQKELVLNADDTSNFLKAVNIVREIAQTIDLRSGSMLRGVGPYLPPVVGSETQGVVDQQVSIQASFPNVVNHNEIEEAFNNLINTSVQYANRKIK